MKKAWIAFCILLFIYIAQMAYFYPQLPDRVAIHFSFGGMADNWGSKQALILIQIAVLLLNIFGLIVIARLMQYIPHKYWNLPNKEYWLDASRKNQTIKGIQTLLLWCAANVLMLTNVAFFLTCKANLSGQERLNETVFYCTLGVFVAFMIAWLLALRRQFRYIAPAKR